MHHWVRHPCCSIDSATSCFCQSTGSEPLVDIRGICCCVPSLEHGQRPFSVGFLCSSSGSATMAKKILIVEDHQDTRELLARILRYRGYEPLEATGGYEGIAMSLAEHPDLVLMDLILPDLHGLDAAKQIKANAETAQIPIVAYTAWYQRDMRAKALEAGITEYLLKPVSTDVLVEVIERLTGLPTRQ